MNVMPGTFTPEQLQMQQAIVEALRQPQMAQQATPMMQSNRVVAASGGMGQGMDALGQGLGKFGDSLGFNMRTANTYGTNPLSQQTNMLAAQDAAFR